MEKTAFVVMENWIFLWWYLFLEWQHCQFYHWQQRNRAADCEAVWDKQVHGAQGRDRAPRPDQSVSCQRGQKGPGCEQVRAPYPRWNGNARKVFTSDAKRNKIRESSYKSCCGNVWYISVRCTCSFCSSPERAAKEKKGGTVKCRVK